MQDRDRMRRDPGESLHRTVADHIRTQTGYLVGKWNVRLVIVVIDGGRVRRSVVKNEHLVHRPAFYPFAERTAIFRLLVLFPSRLSRIWRGAEVPGLRARSKLRCSNRLKNTQPFGYVPKGWAFSQSAYAEILGFLGCSCRFASGNPKTHTTFLLQSLKTGKDKSLTN